MRFLTARTGRTFYQTLNPIVMPLPDYDVEIHLQLLPDETVTVEGIATELVDLNAAIERASAGWPARLKVDILPPEGAPGADAEWVRRVMAILRDVRHVACSTYRVVRHALEEGGTAYD